MQYLTVIGDYLTDLLHGKGLSRSTHITYGSALRAYGAYLEAQGIGPAESIDYRVALTKDQMRRYIYHLSGRGLRPRTVGGALNALRGLCSYLVDEKALDHNPATTVPKPKKDAAQRDIVTDEDAWALLAVTERYCDKRKSLLHRAILSTLIFTGLRAAEVCDLKLCDLHLKSGELVVAQGKGAKARTLYPPQEFWETMEAWLTERNKMGCKHDYVFAQAVHKRVAYDGLSKIVHEARLLSGVKNSEGITPHSIRHNFASRMHRNGATINQVQAALGHSTPNTTFLYLRLHEGDTKAMAHFAARPQSSISPEKTDKLPIRESELTPMVSMRSKNDFGTKLVRSDNLLRQRTRTRIIRG